MLSNYVVANDPSGSKAIKRETRKPRPYLRDVYRTFLFSLVVLLLPGLSLKLISWRILIALVFALFSLALPFFRNNLVNAHNDTFRRLIAEWEILANGMFIIIAGSIISKSSLKVYSQDALISLPLSSTQLTVSLLTIGGVLFLLEGGTQITRGVLLKTGTAPEVSQEKPTQEAKIDRKEYNRGKYIGNLERLMVLAVVLLGSYETIGFIIAGKGLIRAKEFENRDFAEYFLIGTLTSTALAMAVGFLIKFASSRLGFV